jgi:phosphatidylglycerophosphatase A
MTTSEQDERSRPEERLSFFTRFIATGFFAGYISWASGTFGSLVGALFFFIPNFSDPIVLSIAIIIGLIAGVYTSAKVAAVEGDTITKSAQRTKNRFQPERHDTPDPSIVVIDEVVGMWISMFAIYPSPVALIIAFFAFRGFDIIKPYPARQLERYQNGWGIMLDDVIAGIYANISTRVLIAILLSFFPTIF